MLSPGSWQKDSPGDREGLPGKAVSPRGGSLACALALPRAPSHQVSTSPHRDGTRGTRQAGTRTQPELHNSVISWFLIDLQASQCYRKTGSSLKVYQHFSPKANPAACSLCNPSSPWHHHQDLGFATQVSKSGIKIAVAASVSEKNNKKRAPNRLKPSQYSLKKPLGTSLQFIAVLGT